MSILTFRDFLTGRPAWRPDGVWHPVTAAAMTLAILAAGQFVSIAAVQLMAPDLASQPTIPDPDGSRWSLDSTNVSLLLLGQSALAALTLLAVRAGTPRVTEGLGLVAPAGGARAFIFAVLLMVPLMALTNAIAYGLSPSGFASDFEQFTNLARTADPLAGFLSIAVGAPMWEELLFRGFLLPPLVAGLGFWPAATLVSGIWAVLHLGYSLAGLIEVFLIGLYLSWLYRRTGSLWVPIACHGGYNATLFLTMRLWV